MGLNVLWFAPLPTALVAQATDHPGMRGVLPARTLSSDQQFELLRNGTIDAAVTAIDNVVIWNLKAPEARFRAIAQVERTTELMLVARPGIAAISDLAGSTLLVDSATNGFVIALRAMLVEAGIDETLCTLEPAGGVTERLDALLTGRGDATLLGPPFHQAAIAHGCRIVGRVQSSWPEFPGQGLVVNTHRLAPSRQDCILSDISGMLKAMGAARHTIKSHPDEALAILERAGVPTQVAVGMLDTVPETWLPDALGIDCLIRHRATIWPEGPALFRQDLVDESVLTATQPINEKG